MRHGKLVQRSNSIISIVFLGGNAKYKVVLTWILKMLAQGYSTKNDRVSHMCF